MTDATAAAGTTATKDQTAQTTTAADAGKGTIAGDAGKGDAGTGATGGAATGAGTTATATGTTTATATGTTATAATGTTDANWRDQEAAFVPEADRTAFRAKLDRFADKGAWLKSTRELETKLRSGAYKPVADFPEKGTDEEKATWRKERGVPDAPDGYKPELPGGMVVGDADKPIVDDFAKAAHAGNWDSKTFNQALGWYYQRLDAVAAERQAADDTHRNESTTALKDEWGKDYNRNVQAVRNLLGKAPADVSERLTGGRTADGKLIGSDPAVLKWLAQTALDLDPLATVMPAGRADVASLESRKGDIKKMMGDQTSDYWRGPKAAALQKEYRDILDAEARLNARK